MILKLCRRLSSLWIYSALESSERAARHDPAFHFILIPKLWPCWIQRAPTLPPTFFRRASSWSMIPDEVVTTITPNCRQAIVKYCCSQWHMMAISMDRVLRASWLVFNKAWAVGVVLLGQGPHCFREMHNTCCNLPVFKSCVHLLAEVRFAHRIRSHSPDERVEAVLPMPLCLCASCHIWGR